MDVGAAGNAAAPHSPMDVNLLERLVKLMAANDLNTVDLRDGLRRVVLKRGAVPAVVAGAPPQMVAPAMFAAPQGTHSGGSSAPAPVPAGGTAPPGAGESDADLIAIKSPMVGTFYSSPSPEARPFVSVGDTVDEEADVCIIEAMKVFNNIKAECRGTIARILVGDGQTVEFGQVLFLVKPS